jgi:hypothetical protein
MNAPRYCIFILTHGRANNVITYQTLRRVGYTGPIYLVIDTDDDQGDLYREKFGEANVCVFDKKDYDNASGYDSVDNFDEKCCIWYARNACFDIAERLGYEYFIELDDDYYDFLYTFDENDEYKASKRIHSMNEIIAMLVNYFKNTPQVTALAMAQGGDFIGGSEGSMGEAIKLKRKAMNSFICSTKRRFKFVGRINEDVNTYTSEAARGLLFLTTSQVRVQQLMTQQNSGGMTGSYLELGTYVKSFYTVVVAPSCTTIRCIGEHTRLHHNIRWENAVPKIISERWRTASKNDND